MDNSSLLAALPEPIRGQLLSEFNKLLDNYREARYESSEMSGGKLCEIVYTILHGYLSGSIPDKHEHGPRDMRVALNNLERDFPSTMGRPARIQIPRVLIGIYELRNNRGVGHAGGDVSPNQMDATYIVNAIKWVMAELIRIFHDVDTSEAQSMVEIVVEREMPMIWNIGQQKRVISGAKNKLEETLLLLYSVSSAKDQELFKWIEYSNFSVYKSKILNPGHKQRLWEYDSTTGVITLSLLGGQYAETIIKRQN